jgi:hypothetical protein
VQHAHSYYSYNSNNNNHYYYNYYYYSYSLSLSLSLARSLRPAATPLSLKPRTTTTGGVEGGATAEFFLLVNASITPGV